MTHALSCLPAFLILGCILVWGARIPHPDLGHDITVPIRDNFPLSPHHTMEVTLAPGKGFDIEPTGMRPSTGYEVRVSYLGSAPVDITLRWDDGKTVPSPAARTLLDAEKIIFVTDAAGLPVRVSQTCATLSCGNLHISTLFWQPQPMILVDAHYNGVSAQVGAEKQPVKFAISMSDCLFIPSMIMSFVLLDHPDSMGILQFLRSYRP